MKNKNRAICNNCGRNITVKPKKKMKGEIEYTFFKCIRCGHIYVVSCTDKELRESIKRYQDLVSKNQIPKTQGNFNQEELQEAQALLKQNIERSRQLKELHPMEG